MTANPVVTFLEYTSQPMPFQLKAEHQSHNHSVIISDLLEATRTGLRRRRKSFPQLSMWANSASGEAYSLTTIAGALATLPAEMQRVHTRTRRRVPLSSTIFTVWRFGSQRRRVLL